MAAKVTPLQALQLGLSMDVDAVDPSTQDTLTEQLRRDPSGRSSALLNDPKMTGRLIKANAVIGLAAKGQKTGVNVRAVRYHHRRFGVHDTGRWLDRFIGRTVAPTAI